jgi:hypothetical protein
LFEQEKKFQHFISLLPRINQSCFSHIHSYFLGKMFILHYPPGQDGLCIHSFY